MEFGSKKRVLVVDDNHSLVRVIKGLLEMEGYEVLTAFDGLAGLQMAQEEKPDLVILDIKMPKMNGYQVCRDLASQDDTADIPILMLTRRGRCTGPDLRSEEVEAGVRERIEAFDSGALEFLSKPPDVDELLTRVQGLIWFGSQIQAA